MTEDKIYHKVIRPLCKKNRILVHRFESQSIPDVYMSKNGYVLWAELKSIKHYQAEIKPDWRIGQLAWIKRHAIYYSYNLCLILFYIDRVYFLKPKESYNPEELVDEKEYYLNILKKESVWKKTR